MSADAALQLFFACRLPEVCCRSSYIVYISLKILFLRQLFHFRHNRLFAAASDLSSLMVRECTEAASAKASTGAYNTEFYFLERRYASHFIIHGMPLVFKRQSVDVIQLFPFKRRLRRILNHVDRIRVLFCQRDCRYTVVVFKLKGKAPCISFFICRYFIKGWQNFKASLSCAFCYGKILSSVAGSPYPGYIPCSYS